VRFHRRDACPALTGGQAREVVLERTISFTLNGKPVRMTLDDERMLLWVLRYDLGLTGTKFAAAPRSAAPALSWWTGSVRACSIR